MKLQTLVANTRLSISRTVMKSFRIRVIESYEGLPVQIRTENLSTIFEEERRARNFMERSVWCFVFLYVRIFSRAGQRSESGRWLPNYGQIGIWPTRSRLEVRGVVRWVI